MIPGTLSSNGLSEDYSSSFFDDYDDPEYQSDFTDFDTESPSDEGSDDGFDESTLWEIANLLDSTEVPSRNSLLPQLRIIEDYDDSDDEVMPATRAPIVKFMPIMPLSPNPRSPAIKEDAESDPERLALTPEPVIETQWPLPPVSTVPSVKIGADGLPEDSASYCLWAGPSSSLENVSEPTAWAEPPAAWLAEKSHLPKNPRDTMTVKSKGLSKSTILSKPKSLLWAPSKPSTIVESRGLFTVASSSRATRVTNQEPAAVGMVRKPRPSTAPLPTITSSSLWSDNRRMSLFTVDWISESTVRARSPSVASSSGRSSPETPGESDTLSITTVGTKASSLWSESSAMEVPFMLMEAGPAKVKKVSPTSKRSATPEEWDEALMQAIKASAVPAMKVEKPTATKAMWDEALQEALQASAVSPAVGSVGRMWSPSSASTPETMSSGLLWNKDEPRSSTDLPSLSPLARPIVKKWSVSLILPELTCTSMWSVPSLTDGPVERNWMHEAAGISQQASAVSPAAKMWSPSSASAPKIASSALLWFKDASLSSTDLPSLSPVASQTVKKSPTSVSSTLPKLTSTSLWSAPLSAHAAERNWMSETALVSQTLPMGIWTPPAPSPNLPVPAARSLRTPTPASPPHSPASASSDAVSRPGASSPPPAAHILQPASPEMEPWSREAKERASLPVVQSTRLWHPSWASWGEEEKEEKDWAGKRKSSGASFKY